MPPHMQSIPLEEPPGLADPVRAQAKPRDYQVVWAMVVKLLGWHVAALYGLHLCFTAAMWATLIFNVFIYVAQMLGVVAGAHRLWSHRAYKAKLPLQIILMLFHTMSWQKTVVKWARDHRIHHKYSDTDADPHNATRGFFFSHVGWLLLKKHPEVLERGKEVDLSDLTENPVLQFQKKYFNTLTVSLVFALPVLVPVYFWQETISTALHVSLFRLCIFAHAVFSVNSFAHMFGNKPYDKRILPAQNISVSVFTLGEGYHNYHHAFPWDYRVSEFGNRYLNLATIFIDFFAWVGWAYDLKYATDDMVSSRAVRTGDGTDLWGRVEEDKSNKWECGKNTPGENKKAILKQE